MDTNFHEVYSDVDQAIDFAFENRFVLKFYEYLKTRSVTKKQVEEFISSQTANEISDLVSELDEYLEDLTTITNNFVKHMVTFQNLRQGK